MISHQSSQDDSSGVNEQQDQGGELCKLEGTLAVEVAGAQSTSSVQRAYMHVVYCNRHEPYSGTSL